MKESASYQGFPRLPDQDEIVQSLVHDPPDIRWRVVRKLFRIEDPKDREELIEKLNPYLDQAEDFRVKYRINLALQALHRPLSQGDFTLVKGKGVYNVSELEHCSNDSQLSTAGWFQTNFLPVVDFHIHPKSPDIKFFSDIKEAGVTHGVLMATDTDPSDVDRPEITAMLKKTYSKSPMSYRMPFERLLKHIKSSLYSPSHVTNQDVADWVEDYPDILFGFGSVNLSRDKDYVEAKLDEIDRLKLKGIKLLPHSQFFNPADNENMPLLFEFCRQTGSIILSHTGCGPGPFEIPELSWNAHPDLWKPMVSRYPDVPLVLAHFGAYSTEIPGIWLHEALQLGKKHRNVYADLAAVEWLLNRETVVNEIRKTIGFSRVLFASDYPLPLTAGVSLAYLVSSIKANTYIGENEKRKVLGGNAARLLGIA